MMFGFSITKDNNTHKCINNMIDKFSDDKVFFENEEYVLILDGYVLNKVDLIVSTENNTRWSDIIIQLYIHNGDTFFNVFRGSFSGVLFDKKQDKLIIFTDHIGSKFLYYTINDGILFCSSMIDNVYNHLKERGIKYDLVVENAYLLLSYGYMIEDRTLCDKIKKLEPGCYLLFNDGKSELKQYYMLDNTPNEDIDEDQAIELMDKMFREAIRLEFEKDKEYGYNHLVGLSAGLDSRMVSWIAHEMGYTKQLNMTFSQNNYYDDTISKKIAEDLKHEWIFKSLDNGLWLYDVDEITKLTGGNVLYYGLAHANSLCKYLNYNNLGGAHTGMIGDVIFGTFNTTYTHEKFEFGQGAYSTTYLHKIKDITLSGKYINKELAILYYRGFEGCMHGLPRVYNRTEMYSPFLYLDLLEQALKIPYRYRLDHRIYKRWILKKYPEAADYVWEKIGRKISRTSGIVRIKGYEYAIEELPKRILRKSMKKIGVKIFNNFVTKQHMNPIGYYINTNEELRDFIDKYIDDNIDKIQDIDLKKDILRIKDDKTAYMEKIQVLSLLSALKIYY